MNFCDLCTKKWKNFPTSQTFSQIETLYGKNNIDGVPYADIVTYVGI